jgi:Cytochrome P460
MMRRWIGLLALFIVSVGIAIACVNLPALQSNYSSEPQTNFAQSSYFSPVRFPVNYKQQFMQYATVDCPKSGIVRKLYINREGLQAIATSQTVSSGTVIAMETFAARPSKEGQLIPTQLSSVFVREKRRSWNIPDSGEWQSAWYSPSGALVSAEQSSCIGCHTRVRDRDYLFTLPALITATQTNQLQKQQTEFGTSVCR